jgi:beta-lactamase class D
MKFFKIIIFTISFFITNYTYADPSYSKIFDKVEACFTFYDLNKEKVITSFNEDRCKERISPCSSFKIPLSIIGFDSGILKDENYPKWNYKPEYPAVIESHAKDHIPKSWMANSVVWYSQILTKELGIEKFKEYVSKFSYGNQDLSGNPGKNDGLTEAWLNSSLKISANEQIEFLKKAITYNLPVSKEAINYTKKIMFLEELPSGWKLYGKTGSSQQKNTDGSKKENMGFGWFVGFIEKQNQIYIFAANIYDKQESKEYAGPRVKAMVKEILSGIDILK